MRKVKILLVLAILPCILPRIRNFYPAITSNLGDFHVYYTAGVLVREGQGAAIYSGADSGSDPQQVITDESTLFGREAIRLGVIKPTLYVYPPLLADLMVPFAYFSLAVAGKIWTFLSFVQLLILGFLITKLLKIPFVSLGSVAILIGLFWAQPVIFCITFGQVGILLLLLWVGGVYFYNRGWLLASAFVFALATAIKLTPLIVIIPLLIWREWKLLGRYVAALFFFGVITCIVNTPHALTDYFFHVMPFMSNGIPDVMNWSILAAVQRFYAAFHHGTTFPVTKIAIPASLFLLTKMFSLLLLILVTLPVYKLGVHMIATDRIMALAVYLVLSVGISPVSWPHAYPACLFALSLCWARAIREGISNPMLIFLAVCSVILTSYLIPHVVLKMMLNPAHDLLTCTLLALLPGACLGLVWIGLWGISSPPEAQVI